MIYRMLDRMIRGQGFKGSKKKKKKTGFKGPSERFNS